MMRLLLQLLQLVLRNLVNLYIIVLTLLREKICIKIMMMIIMIMI